MSSPLPESLQMPNHTLEYNSDTKLHTLTITFSDAVFEVVFRIGEFKVVIPEPYTPGDLAEDLVKHLEIGEFDIISATWEYTT